MSGVFVLKDPATLVEMKPSSFVSEDEFQKLLVDFPSLLVGHQIDPENPRKWLLISREKSIPSEQGGSGRWSIDHLFLDQDGIPTLVEVKRQSDTRIRREVVGQMLDYAANGVIYWPIEELRSQFEANCVADGRDSIELLAELIGMDSEQDGFWQKVKTNLQAGRIRMLFVADVIPPELRRIVEFLNKQMDPAEMLALELRQYQGEGLRTIVPVLFGQTQEAQSRKAVGAAIAPWDEEKFLEQLAKLGPNNVGIAKQIIEWMKSKSSKLRFGQGSRDGSINITILRNGLSYVPFTLWTTASVEINFGACIKGRFRERRAPEGMARQTERYPWHQYSYR